ncbi:MAG: DNA adenine methylase [Chloroflexota bacterium]|nr:DNA adenine methylase [Chloroflexota bacterium]
MSSATYKVEEMGQLYLFDIDEAQTNSHLDAAQWQGSFNGKESTLQQLSPYVGKLKSGMVRALISRYSRQGDIVLDPFCGSGVVPLEALLSGRQAWANDLSTYAYVLTRGKLEAPESEMMAIEQARGLVASIKELLPSVDTSVVPDWIREFYHPDTLREIVVAFKLLRTQENYFLMACLLGILHHVRPGFLSYPASHLVPYLRVKMYPPEQYPAMYAYRDLESRLLAKVHRAYRRGTLPPGERPQHKVWQVNSMSLPIAGESVDSIISSPPYFGALDYARDNRLRLWFLGCEDWKELDKSLTANSKVYLPQMGVCLKEMERVLKPGGHCVLVLGDVERDGRTRRTAEILGDLASEVTEGRLSVGTIYDDLIPDERRSRRETKTTRFERILMMKKSYSNNSDRLDGPST